MSRRQLIAAAIAKHAVHNQKDHGNRDGRRPWTVVPREEYKDDLTVEERFGEFFTDDYGESRSPDDPAITFFDTGGVSFIDGDYPTTPEARELVSNSSQVEGYWGSYYGAERVRAAAAELTGTDAWEGVMEGPMVQEPALTVGWDEDAGVSIYGAWLEPDQIAYTYLYDMHHQTGSGEIADGKIYRGVGVEFPDVKEGDTIEFGLASFTPDQGTALGFGTTIIVVDEGAKIRSTSDPIFEVLSGGSFKVRMVRSNIPNSSNRRRAERMIFVTQTATYDPETGELS